ncbi:MAG: hypothetical protein ABR881_00265 [Candidatus Sulfotelmatobacter sp.]|jgi:hypothetical protein
MPDWREKVRELLGAGSLPPENREEVILELAAHLEETYEDGRAGGLTEQAAVERALQEVEDWHILSAHISRARSEEDPMNDRTRNLWLPAMVSLLGASVLLMTLQRVGFQPRLVWIGRMAMLFYWPWLAGLPVFGAFGAYLSQRAQGPVRARLAAALCPVLVLLITLCLILPWALAIDGFSALRLAYFGLAVANWVAIPGLALLLGALPFLREAGVREA